MFKKGDLVVYVGSIEDSTLVFGNTYTVKGVMPTYSSFQIIFVENENGTYWVRCKNFIFLEDELKFNRNLIVTLGRLDIYLM